MRPRSLAQVAHLAAAGEPFDYCLAGFLDEFRLCPQGQSLAETPLLQAPAFGDPGKVRDAYLAAVAEQLACQHGFPVPPWVHADARKLHRPWFASPLAALRAVLLLESPPSFRARNLFVSENALSRV
jgi:hypothetical protein